MAKIFISIQPRPSKITLTGGPVYYEVVTPYGTYYQSPYHHGRPMIPLNQLPLKRQIIR